VLAPRGVAIDVRPATVYRPLLTIRRGSRRIDLGVMRRDADEGIVAAQDATRRAVREGWLELVHRTRRQWRSRYANLADLERMLAVNLLGPLIVSRAVLPAMLRRGSGSIVNVASQLGKSGIADFVTYCATKFAVVGFTEALADELRSTGVRVWSVCPGLVDTEMARRAVGITGRERAGLIRPESVARTIVALAAGERRAPSGAAVDVLR